MGNQSVKNILVFLLIIGAGAYVWKNRQPDSAQKQSSDVIANPVYAEARVKMSVMGREIEGVMLGKTVDQADCQKNIETIKRQMEIQSPHICPTCRVETTTQCKTELLPRYARLFDNEPTSVSYISLGQGDPSEREYRLIYWGVTVEESGRLCSAVPQIQRGRKGVVTCIRSPQG